MYSRIEAEVGNELDNIVASELLVSSTGLDSCPSRLGPKRLLNLNYIVGI